MNYTKFRTLTDAELFSVIQTARRHSPIIEELAGWLERADAQKPRAFSCPVCEAELLGSVNLIDDCLTVKVKQ